jgi:uncharacterized membrane protein (DUF485 family)
MLTETVVSTILQASITGAGLIIAIYALITPIMDKIFKERVRLHEKKKQEFDKLKEKIDAESSKKKDFERLTTLSKEIKGIKMFPRYLGVGVLIVFICYMFAATFAYSWLMMSQPARTSVLEFWIVLFFGFSMIGFLIVGMYTIFDVYRAMKGEFEKVKKEKEEVERISKAFEEKGLVVRGLVKKKREKDAQKQE